MGGGFLLRQPLAMPPPYFFSNWGPPLNSVVAEKKKSFSLLSDRVIIWATAERVQAPTYLARPGLTTLRHGPL